MHSYNSHNSLRQKVPSSWTQWFNSFRRKCHSLELSDSTASGEVLSSIKLLHQLSWSGLGLVYEGSQQRRRVTHSGGQPFTTSSVPDQFLLWLNCTYICLIPHLPFNYYTHLLYVVYVLASSAISAIDTPNLIQKVSRHTVTVVFSCHLLVAH